MLAIDHAKIICRDNVHLLEVPEVKEIIACWQCSKDEPGRIVDYSQELRDATLKLRGVENDYEVIQREMLKLKQENGEFRNQTIEECANLIETDCWTDPLHMVNQKNMALHIANFIRKQLKSNGDS